MIFRFTLFLFLTGCAAFSGPQIPEPTYGPRDRVYFADFDSVWRATQLALQKYPMRINNMDLGVLETETIKGYRVWSPPHAKKGPSGGMRYKLNVRVVKGNVEGKVAIRVTILKDLSIQKDFFSERNKLPSDGLEELSILYRIGREIKIEKALKRAQKRMNQG